MCFAIGKTRNFMHVWEKYNNIVTHQLVASKRKTYNIIKPYEMRLWSSDTTNNVGIGIIIERKLRVAYASPCRHYHHILEPQEEEEAAVQIATVNIQSHR